MRLFKGLEVPQPLPALLIKPIRALVIADLHLGFEGIAAERGIFIPKVQFAEELEMLEQLLDLPAEKIIINGDLKHEFSETSYHEFREVSEMLEFLTKNFDEVFLVKGNHDNYLAIVAKKFGLNVFESLELGDFFFTHGHKEFDLPEQEFVILAHEHPSIALVGDSGKDKVKAFLYGELEGKKVVVLPAFSTLASGTEINLISPSELLSPFLRNAGVDELRALGIDKDLGFLKFPELRHLRYE